MTTETELSMWAARAERELDSVMGVELNRYGNPKELGRLWVLWNEFRAEIEEYDGDRPTG